MVCFPNCKINIGLYVTGRRNDGYHNLETVFYPVHAVRSGKVMNDVLEIVPATGGESKLHMSGLAVAGPQDSNLVWKAYEMLLQAYPDRITPIDIYLHKAVPMGAGLGGGSADGAYMIRLMNDYYGLGMSVEKMAEMALMLGSDCPFFVYNTPQHAMGRGERMKPIALDLAGYEIEVVCPGIHVSTRDAFSQIVPAPAAYDLRGIGALPVEEWKHYVFNDFERTVFQAHPELAEIKQQLYERGAVYASMTGTGSAVYGIFRK